jgi:hypothetical protein
MFPDGLEMNDTSMTIEQQLQVQCALDSVEVDTADKATDANGHPSTDLMIDLMQRIWLLTSQKIL